MTASSSFRCFHSQTSFAVLRSHAKIFSVLAEADRKCCVCGGSSATHRFDVNMLVFVLLLHVSSAFLSTDAPANHTGHCHLRNLKYASTVVCRHASGEAELRRDLKTFDQSRPYRLTVSYIPMKMLPAFLFQNLTFDFLRVIYCGLESLHDDSLAGDHSLDLLDLSDNKLTTVPAALRALKSLRMLYITNNRITTLGVELSSFSSTLGKIVLSGNVISTIHKDALKDMTSLMRFSLKYNKVKSIPPELFRNAPRLQHLDLRWNLIEDVDNLFDGLLELHTLKLDANNIRQINALSSSTLPSLQSLTLDYNPIVTFTLFDSRQAAVENLSLQYCNISDVASIPFACIDRLRFLKVAHNRINHIDKNSFPKSVNTTNYNSFGFSTLYASRCESSKSGGILLVIDVSHNAIDAINDAFHGIQLLELLRISYNQIENVPDDAFKTNVNLKRLDLSDNRIAWVGEHAFRGLVSLEKLSLDSNRLMSLNGSLAFMPRLVTVHLQDNRLLLLGGNEFRSLPMLTDINAMKNNITDVRGAFRSLEAIEKIQLHDNNLTSIHRASFPNAVKRLRAITLEGNPLMCDCQLAWLYEIPVLYDEFTVPLCHGPPRLAGTSFLSNETRDSLGVWLEDCDKNCTCTCTVSGYRRLINVDCSNQGLKEMPRTFPNDTSVVDLSSNLLDSVGGTLAKYAPGLQSLNLSNNLYTNIDWKLLPRNLSSLHLQNNLLSDFPLDLVLKLNLSGIWLSGNPWSCGCEDYAFRQWAGSHGAVIKDARDVRCAAGPNSRVSSMLFMDLDQKDLCPYKLSLFVVYGVPLLVVLSLCLTMTMIYVKRERQIKIWLYAAGFGCVKEDELDKDKMFDVFLSFSSKDGDWAYANLLPRLEEFGFSVCTYDRNFKGGFLLQDIIQEAVACSRRTLLLLTQNFVESEWCRWEFRVAHHSALQDKVNRLIVVVVGNIPENVDDDLALYMKTTNYLCWEEKNFWDKVRYSLPKKDTKRRESPSSPLWTIYKNNNTERQHRAP